MRQKSIRWCLLVSTIIFFPALSEALEYQYSLFGNGEKSDNIFRSEDDQESSEIYNTGVTFSAQSTEGEVLQTNVSALLGKTFYSDNDIDDENLRGFEGGVVYSPNRSNFSLTLADSYAQIQSNRFVTNRVSNSSDVNVFAALPRYFLRLSGRDQINFEFLYSNVSDRDADSGLGDVSRTIIKPAIGYERAISKISDLAFYVAQTDTKYDELEDSDYEERSAFLRLSSSRRQTAYVLDVGRSEITTDAGNSFDGNLIGFSLSRQVNANDRITFRYNQDYGNLVNTDVSIGVINLNINDQAGYIDEVIEQKRFRAQYSHDGAYVDVSASIYQDFIESLFGDREEDSIGGDLAIVFNYGQLLKTASQGDITFRLGYEKSSFENVGIENDEIYTALRYNSFLTNNLLVFAEYRHENIEERTLLANGDVTENSIMIGFSYSPLGRIKGF
ncbi:MAG: hypothetical protein K6L75_05675 [Cellvibrionaceae bacterium]